MSGKTAISRAELDRRRAADEPLSTSMKRYLRCLERGDRDDCAYCGVPLNDRNRTIDHRVSVIRGGSNDMSNLCLACHDCNERKSSMSADEFVAYLKLVKPALQPTTSDHSLGVKTARRRTVPIGSLLSDESKRALASIKRTAMADVLPPYS